MAFDREAAKAEGYSDDEINAYLQAEAEKKKQPTAPVVDVGEPPAPQTKINEVGTSAEAIGTTAGLAVAPYVLPAAGAAAAAVGGSKLYGAWNASAEAAKALADAKLASEQGIAQRNAQKMAQQAGSAMRPINPSATYNVPTQNVPQMRAPLPTVAPVAPTAMPGVPSAGPVAPTAMPGMPAAAPAPSSPSIMSRMRALAANKVLQGAGNLAKGSIGPGMAMYSGGLNTNEEEELRKRRMMQPTIDR